MTLTVDQLKQVMPAAGKRIDTFIDPLNQTLERFNINTPAEQAMFIAQLAHESGEFRYVREIASGTAYEGRRDLGNTEVGDGVRFRGRGLIQITGRHNYAECSLELFGDERLLLTPQILEQPLEACLSAGWYWSKHSLGRFADDIKACTRKINGGFNGLAERTSYWERAKRVLEAD